MIGHDVGEALVGTDHPRERQIGVVGQLREDLGDVLEGLRLEQTGEQHVALFPQRELVVEVDVGGIRQQATGLELDQRGGDQQESGRDVEVEQLHPLDLGEVGVDDARQVDLVDVDLFTQDQLQSMSNGPS
jgi:hypothetical protein